MPNPSPSPHAPLLRTDRLVLTGHRPADLDGLAAMWGDPRVYAGIGGQPRPREEVWIRLLRSIGTWTAFGYGSWVVRETADGPPLGEVGLIEAKRAIDPPLTATETGWTLSPERHGRGYAREAMAAVLGWADAQGMARTQCIIDPGNAASIRLATVLGYVRRGEARYHDRAILCFERIAAG